MKKIISLLVIILMVFVLEFNLLGSLLPQAHIWVEPLLAFIAIAGLLIWNDLVHNRK